MSKELEGRVAIVTGAAEGLGRRHALQLASMGASVVVNDVGGSLEGEGADTSKAQAVVDEIEAAGGTAVTHHGDVSDWSAAEGMIQHAVDSFGSLDILVNNAGIMRDQTIFNISEKDFDDVVRVHLKGHFAPTKFACNYWRAKSKAAGGPVFGRIVATSSEAFLFGSPGQPNYAAAALCSAQTGGASGCAQCSSGTCDTSPFGGVKTTIWNWLSVVNFSNYGGYNDWRIPEVDRDGGADELESILDESQGNCEEGTGPCIDPIFGPTALFPYWSSSPYSSDPSRVWGISFYSGQVFGPGKTLVAYVRAVRGGS